MESQLVHGVGVSYVLEAEPRRSLTTAAEVQNVTNVKTYDFYGVQRPGRAVFFKTTLQL